MKKLLLILTMIMVIVCSVGCGNENEKKLKREVESVNSLCPAGMGIVGNLLSVKYDEDAKEVQLFISLNDNLISLDALIANEKLAAKSIKLSFSKGEPKELLEQMINAGAGLSITYRSALSLRDLKVRFSCDELKEMHDNELSDIEINKLLLENQLALENARCPYVLGEGMELVKAYDDGKNIVYACRIDDQTYKLSAIRDATDVIKQRSIELFKQPVMQKQLEVMTSLDKGFILTVSGTSSGESFDIVFSSDELKQL